MAYAYYAKCRDFACYALRRKAECHFLIVMVNVVMLSVVAPFLYRRYFYLHRQLLPTTSMKTGSLIENII
jgi:hypothetical protein